jgi:hypothetical protein
MRQRSLLVSETIPPVPPATNPEMIAVAALAALLKQLMRMNASIEALKAVVFPLIAATSLDPQAEMKARAAFALDIEMRVRRSEENFSNPATWREVLELLIPKADPSGPS